jgi:acyl dehydratase
MTLRDDRGACYEDVSAGDSYVSPGRTVTAADVAAFAGLTGDYAPMYTDDTYARHTPVGRRQAHGLLGLGLVEGLMIRVPPGEGRGIASLGWRWLFHAPLIPGDTVRARWEIAAKRRSARRLDRGIVEEAVRLENQRGEVIQAGVHAVLLACRDARGDSAAPIAPEAPRSAADGGLDAVEEDPGGAAGCLLAAGLAPVEQLDGMRVYLEDLKPGERFASPRRTVTEADVVSFAGITGDYAMIHTDEEYCRGAGFGTRIAHGLLGLSLVEGLKRRVSRYAGLGDTMMPLMLAWSFRKPIVPGDTLEVSWVIEATQPCRTGGEGGWVVEQVQLLNQRAEVVQEGRQMQAIQRRPAAGP